MGSVLSVNNTAVPSPLMEGASKRLKISLTDSDPRLIPTLPDEISFQILARVPRVKYMSLKLVSRAWKAAVTGQELFDVRREVGKSEEWIYLLLKREDSKLSWYAIDPLSKKWLRLPPMPHLKLAEDQGWSFRLSDVLSSSVRIVDAVRGWLGRNDKTNQMTLSGCSFGVIGGSLYVLGGLSKSSTLDRVWRYDPIQNSWNEACPMSTGRAYCKIGVLNDKLYVVGGVTRGRGGLTPLLSAEVFDPSTGVWSELPSMPFSKAQAMPTALLADLLKPIATGIASYQGKLYVPQSLYCWPFFVDVGGEVYDPMSNSWDEMPPGMGESWPAKQAGTKMSATINGDLYGLDPSSSLDNAQIKVYDHKHDTWEVVARDVPIHNLVDSEIPYLLAGLLGKLHVITKDASHNIIIMQADIRNHLRPAADLSDGSSISFELPTTHDSEIWKVIATRSGRSAHLVGCQVLNV
uniref:F-box domain-containing protein n=1 Tax=Kalanchoe fedtschenkoi TaxID=63787 RepID=A0A7N0T180_KALFE